MPTPGLVLLLGVWFGLSFSEKLSPRFGVNGDKLYNLTFISLLAGILGARLTYIAGAPQAFLDNPLAIVSLNTTSLDPLGGIAIAILAGMYYAHQNGMFNWKTLDALTPFGAVLTIAFGISHLASGKMYGIMTDLPWGLYLWKANRHPTQIYEIILGATSLGLMWFMIENLSPEPGQTFVSFSILISAGHLYIGGFRGDYSTIIAGIRTGQAVAFLFLAFFLWLYGQTFSEREAET